MVAAGGRVMLMTHAVLWAARKPKLEAGDAVTVTCCRAAVPAAFDAHPGRPGRPIYNEVS